MVVDYSKWDKLELSDDSDIEVHPNVDKRSFIRWKQRDIHEKREQQKLRMETLEVNIETNTDLLRRVHRLIEAAENGIDVFGDFKKAVGLSAEGETKSKPSKATSPEQPKYDDMIESLLATVVADAKDKPQLLAELKKHHGMLQSALQVETKELESLKEERSRHINSEDIRTGWNSTIVYHKNKDAGSEGAGSNAKCEVGAGTVSSSGSKTSTATTIETINAPRQPVKPKVNEDGLEELLPATKRFGEFKLGAFEETYKYLSQHPEIITANQKDSLMLTAFDLELSGKHKEAKTVIHNALLILYCSMLGPGPEGVRTFYSRIVQEDHPARKAFDAEVEKTYEHIQNRCKVLQQEQEAESKAEGVEQIQLHSVDPNTEIVVHVPEKDSEGYTIYEGFSQELKDAISSHSLDEINKVLAELPVDEAEIVVQQLGESGVLLVEEKVYDMNDWQKIQAELKQEEGQHETSNVEATIETATVEQKDDQ